MEYRSACKKRRVSQAAADPDAAENTIHYHTAHHIAPLCGAHLLPGLLSLSPFWVARQKNSNSIPASVGTMERRCCHGGGREKVKPRDRTGVLPD